MIIGEERREITRVSMRGRGEEKDQAVSIEEQATLVGVDKIWQEKRQMGDTNHWQEVRAWERASQEKGSNGKEKQVEMRGLVKELEGWRKKKKRWKDEVVIFSTFLFYLGCFPTNSFSSALCSSSHLSFIFLYLAVPAHLPPSLVSVCLPSTK